MNKINTISIRLTDNEINQIDIQADMLNITRSEYIRFAIKTAYEDELIPKSQLSKLIHKITCILDTASKKSLPDCIRKELRKWK